VNNHKGEFKILLESLEQESKAINIAIEKMENSICNAVSRMSKCVDSFNEKVAKTSEFDNVRERLDKYSSECKAIHQKYNALYSNVPKMATGRLTIRKVPDYSGPQKQYNKNKLKENGVTINKLYKEFRTTKQIKMQVLNVTAGQLKLNSNEDLSTIDINTKEIVKYHNETMIPVLENFQPKAQEAAVDAIYTIERLLEEQLNEYASSVGRIQNFHDITQSFRNSGNEIFKTSPENFTEVGEAIKKNFENRKIEELSADSESVTLLIKNTTEKSRKASDRKDAALLKQSTGGRSIDSEKKSSETDVLKKGTGESKKSFSINKTQAAQKSVLPDTINSSVMLLEQYTESVSKDIQNQAYLNELNDHLDTLFAKIGMYRWCEAVENYIPEEGEETTIGLEKGEEVELKSDETDGWILVSRKKDGCRGYVPITNLTNAAYH